MIRTWLTQNRDAISVVESLLKIAALLVGAFWTWAAFVRRRLRFPKATLEHIVKSWREADRLFVHVTVRVANGGAVLINIAKGCTWLERLTPLPQSVRESIQSGERVVDDNRSDIEWSLLEKRNTPRNAPIEIEPGEIDDIHFDFVLDPEIERVLIYTHLENEKKARKGWNLSSIYDIPAS